MLTVGLAIGIDGSLLGQRDWSDFGQVIALLILALAGALVNRFRGRRAEDSEEEQSREREIVPRGPEIGTSRGAAPPARPAPREAAKPSRPVRNPAHPLSELERVLETLTGTRIELVRESEDEAGEIRPVRPPERSMARPAQRRIESPRRARAAPVSRIDKERPRLSATAVAAPAVRRRVRPAALGPLDRAHLRRAVLLSEVLGPPVALRETQNAGFGWD